MSMYYFQVRFVRGLPRLEFTILKELAAFADDNDVAWPEIDALVGCTGYGPSSIDDGLTSLENLNLIVTKVTGHKSDAGTFVVDGHRYYLQRSNIDKYIRKDLELSKTHAVEVSPSELASMGISIAAGKRKKQANAQNKASQRLPNAGMDC